MKISANLFINICVKNCQRSKTLSNQYLQVRMASNKVSYLNQDEATALDQDLFNEYKFSVDQLMELAGLSCASAVRKSYSPDSHNKVLIVCGPGNNGGDGLVAARHLALMGFTPEIFYPKRTASTLYENLTHQCVKQGIHFLDTCPSANDIDNTYKVVVDALFGFSFKPPIRESMLPIMTALGETKVDCCCVDIPSGWNVNTGPPTEGPIIKPKVLISLSAPKLCAKQFEGTHYLGGRFIPPGIIEKYKLVLPEYANADQVVLIQ